MIMTTTTQSNWLASDSNYTSTLPGNAGSSLTTSPDLLSPKWNEIYDGLILLWKNTPNRAQSDHEEPTRAAIQSALQIVLELKSRYPMLPPTGMMPDGSGGIILERRDGNILRSFTFYSDGLSVLDIFNDGRMLASYDFAL